MLKRKLALTVLILVTGCLALSCMVPKTITDNQNYVDLHIAGNPKVKSTKLVTDTGIVHYKSYQGTGNAVLVYVHGTPGNWQALAAYLIEPELNALAAVSISIDRPGCGESTLMPNSHPPSKPVQSLAEQSQALGVLLQKLQNDYPSSPIILIGHSLGGSLVARMAMDYPNIIDGVLILAGGINPDLSGLRWYNHIADTWPLKKLLPEDLNQSNFEMAMLQQDLEEMRPLWSKIESPLIVMQGDKDKLVNPEHSNFAIEQLPVPQVQRIQLVNQGHFIPWQRQAEVIKAVKKLIEHSKS